MVFWQGFFCKPDFFFPHTVNLLHFLAPSLTACFKGTATYTLGSRGFSCAVAGRRSPLVSSVFGRRRVGLWPTKLLVAREKIPLVPRVGNLLVIRRKCCCVIIRCSVKKTEWERTTTMTTTKTWKNNWFYEHNNSSWHVPRFLVHFFDVHYTTTTWNFLNSTSEEIAFIWKPERVQIDAIKFEWMQIIFLCYVFIAVVAQAPYYFRNKGLLEQ